MLNKFLLMDYMEILFQIPDNYVDLICIDPPYEINYNNEKWDEKCLNWKFLFLQFNRILKNTGNLIIFQGWSNVCDTINIGNNFFDLKNWIIYDRIKGRGSKTNFVSTREDILWYIKSEKYKFNKIFSKIPKKTKGLGLKNGELNRALSNVWSDISPIVPWSKERNEHPTQKPIELIERVINIFSDEGDIILDCFCGSGTTGIAANNLKRNFICSDKEKIYIEIARNRLHK